MANGKVGDHPLTDIVIYGIEVFSPDVDAIIHELYDLSTFTNLIAHAWLSGQSYLLDTCRKEGRVAYGRSSYDQETILNGMRNVLNSELRRVRQKNG